MIKQYLGGSTHDDYVLLLVIISCINEGLVFGWSLQQFNVAMDATLEELVVITNEKI